MKSVNEAVQLVHSDGATRRVFVPGEVVSDEWTIPEGYGIETPDPEPAPAPIEPDAEGDDAPADGDEDGDDADPESSGAGPEWSCDMTAPVADIEAAVMAVSAEQRPAAAQWVLRQEAVRPSPRSTLLAKMRSLAS